MPASYLGRRDPHNSWVFHVSSAPQARPKSLIILVPVVPTGCAEKPALVPGNEQAGGGRSCHQTKKRHEGVPNSHSSESTANSLAAEFQSVTPTSLPALQQENHKAPEARLTSPKSSSDHSTPRPEPSRAPNCTQNKDFQILATAWTNSWILLMGKLRLWRD